MKSKFESTCKHCKKIIPIGGNIRRSLDGKYYHWEDDLNCSEEVDEAIQAEQVQEEEVIYSDMQETIFRFVSYDIGNGLIEAVAGSGKTFTIVKSLKFIPSHYSIVLFAFNRHIRDELAIKAPGHVNVKTLHQHGLAALHKHLGGFEVDNKKMDTVLDAVIPVSELLEWEAKKILRAQRRALARVVALVRNTLTDPKAHDLVLEIADRYGVDLEGVDDKIANWTPQVIENCLHLSEVIDFDDMLHIPVALNLPLRQYDFVLVDELQDLNPLQHEIVARSLRPGGRVIGVGDHHQSIYGFRAADTESVPHFAERFKCTKLPLTICYRCPASHIEVIQEKFPEIDIKAKDDAIEGEIEQLSESEMIEELKEGDVGICRLNAPLIKHTLRLIAKGQKAVIIGRDIGASLAILATRFENVREMDTFVARLRGWATKEMAKLANRTHVSQTAIGLIADKAEAIELVSEQCDSPRDIAPKIKSIFSDDRVGISFSTVHRFKGGENDRVFILGPELMPFPMAEQDWELQQEANIEYVALSRSKDYLGLVKLNKRGEDK